MNNFSDDKYIILKKEDVKKFLSQKQQNNILLYQNMISISKGVEEPKYYVCNRNEPYAKDVIMMIMKGEINKEKL